MRELRPKDAAQHSMGPAARPSLGNDKPWRRSLGAKTWPGNDKLWGEEFG